MDGVIVDFVSGALKALGITHMTDKDIVQAEMDKQLGVSVDDFWAAQHKDPDFWQNLKPYPGAVKFYHELTQLADVHICSCPSKHPRCASDKISWMRNHLGEEASNKFYLCRDKSKLACLGRILIDDNEGHITAWEKEAGWTFLFPRPWNAKRYHAVDIAESYELALAYVRTMTQ
jgi:5'(3')-deoxyribonucleotidase